MKKSVLALLSACVSLGTLTLTPAAKGLDPVQFGTGPDSVYLLIESSDFVPAFGSATFLYQYFYTSPPVVTDGDQLNLLTTGGLLTALINADPTDSFGKQHIWDGVGHDTGFLTSLTLQIDSGTPVTVAADFTPGVDTSWFQWSAGGYVDSAYSGTPPFSLIGSSSWTSGPGLEFRYLLPGANDALTFGVYDVFFNSVDGPPATLPVPEPSSALLVIMGFLGFCHAKRRS